MPINFQLQNKSKEKEKPYWNIQNLLFHSLKLKLSVWENLKYHESFSCLILFLQLNSSDPWGSM